MVAAHLLLSAQSLGEPCCPAGCVTLDLVSTAGVVLACEAWARHGLQSTAVGRSKSVPVRVGPLVQALDPWGPLGDPLPLAYPRSQFFLGFQGNGSGHPLSAGSPGAVSGALPSASLHPQGPAGGLQEHI